MDHSAERVARNDAIFRDANEKIRAAAADADVDPVPFLCECADERCHEVVRLAIEEYERIRGESTWFVNALGHDVAGGPHVSVVEEHGGYVIVQKLGRAAEIVEELDPRESAVE